MNLHSNGVRQIINRKKQGNKVEWQLETGFIPKRVKEGIFEEGICNSNPQYYGICEFAFQNLWYKYLSLSYKLQKQAFIDSINRSLLTIHYLFTKHITCTGSQWIQSSTHFSKESITNSEVLGSIRRIYGYVFFSPTLWCSPPNDGVPICSLFDLF